MQAIKLKDVKKGEFIKRKPEAKKVFIRGEYDRSYNKYRCDDWDDISRDIMLKGTTIVFIDFDY